MLKCYMLFWGCGELRYFFVLTPQGWLTNLWEVLSHVAISSLCWTLYSALCHHGNTDTNYSHSVSPPCLPGRSYLTFCGFKLKNTSGSGKRPSGVLTFSCFSRCYCCYEPSQKYVPLFGFSPIYRYHVFWLDRKW